MSRKLEFNEIRDIGLFKYYRTVRRWASVAYEISSADLELLMYFDCVGLFTRKDYSDGILDYTWDKRRWNRFVKDGWVVVWRERNYTTQKYNLYKTSFKTRTMITRIYKILLGDEPLPTSTKRNSIMKGKTYKDKVQKVMIKRVNSDKDR